MHFSLPYTQISRNNACRFGVIRITTLLRKQIVSGTSWIGSDGMESFLIVPLSISRSYPTCRALIPNWVDGLSRLRLPRFMHFNPPICITCGHLLLCTPLIDLVGQQDSERHLHILDPIAIADNRPRLRQRLGRTVPVYTCGFHTFRYCFLTLSSYPSSSMRPIMITRTHIPPARVANTKSQPSIWEIQ
jgi:hypothetical protein